MENQQKKKEREIFANCSQTHFAMRKFRRPISQCENSPTQIRNAKISQCEISQCQNRFRNANFNFAMRKFRNAKFRNAKCHFAMPILNLHCQFQFRNAKISQFQIRNAKISQCEISQCQSPFRIAKFTAFAKFTAARFSGLVILCN